MKLSKIMGLPEDEVEYSYYGVEVDESDYFTPPNNLGDMSIVAEFDENGVLLDNIVDIVVSFSMSGVNVIIEVSFDDAKRFRNTEINGFPFEKYMIQLAANASTVICLLPPKDASKEDREIYLESLGRYTEAFMNQGNLSRLAHPVSIHLESMYLEVLTGDSTLKAMTNEYIYYRFVESISDEFFFEIRDKVKSVIYETFGGEDYFRLFALNAMSKIINRVEGIAKNSTFSKRDVELIEENIIKPSRERRGEAKKGDDS